jgi:poly(A) polymerase
MLDGGEVCRLLGIDEGPEVGRILRRLVEAQIRGTVRTRAEAETFVRQQASTPGR